MADKDKTSELKDTAVHFLVKGKKIRAKEFFYKVLVIDPTDTFARKKVAELLEQEGDLEAAIDHYERLIDIYDKKHMRHYACAVAKRLIEIDAFNTFAKEYLIKHN